MCSGFMVDTLELLHSQSAASHWVYSEEKQQRGSFHICVCVCVFTVAHSPVPPPSVSHLNLGPWKVELLPGDPSN